MSRTTVYKVTASGDVVKFGDAHCAPAGAPIIWEWLYLRYDCRTPGHKYNALQDNAGMERLWMLPDTITMKRKDKVLLVFTFDRVWFKRERLEELSRELREFYEEHGFTSGVFDPPIRVNETLLEVAVMLDKLRADPDCRGAAFNQTSVAESQWYIEDRCVNVDKDGGYHEAGKWLDLP